MPRLWKFDTRNQSSKEIASKSQFQLFRTVLAVRYERDDPPAKQSGRGVCDVVHLSDYECRDCNRTDYHTVFAIGIMPIFCSRLLIIKVVRCSAGDFDYGMISILLLIRGIDIGHPFAGGVLKRRGHTEAALDLTELAGLPPAGVLCEVVNDEDGSMARLPYLMKFAKQHGLPIVSIDALVKYCSFLYDCRINLHNFVFIED